MLTAGITEEVLWRGYAVERAAAWIGPWTASIIGLTIFAVGHLDFFGPGWLLTSLPTAAMFYIMLAWRRNLWAAILVHILGDSPIFVLALIEALRCATPTPRRRVRCAAQEGRLSGECDER